MSIVAGDLIAYAAASRPDDDASTSGGAIATTHKIVFTQMAANDTIEVLSSAGGDTTQQVTVKGRLSTGALSSQTVTLNGTTPVSVTGTWERILRVALDGTCTGTVTLRRTTGPTTIATIAPGDLGVHAFFYDAASAGTQKIRYEKLFWKNTHGSLTLNAAAVKLTADPAAKIKIGLATSKDDTATVANRLAAPAGVSFVDDNVSQSVPTGALAAGEAIGTWIEQTLAISDSPVRSTFTTELSGTTV